MPVCQPNPSSIFHPLSGSLPQRDPVFLRTLNHPVLWTRWKLSISHGELVSCRLKTAFLFEAKLLLGVFAGFVLMACPSLMYTMEKQSSSLLPQSPLWGTMILQWMPGMMSMFWQHHNRSTLTFARNWIHWLNRWFFGRMKSSGRKARFPAESLGDYRPRCSRGWKLLMLYGFDRFTVSLFFLRICCRHQMETKYASYEKNSGGHRSPDSLDPQGFSFFFLFKTWVPFTLRCASLWCSPASRMLQLPSFHAEALRRSAEKPPHRSWTSFNSWNEKWRSLHFFGGFGCGRWDDAEWDKVKWGAIFFLSS